MCIFLLALMHKSVLGWSNLSLESNLMRKGFSQSLFFIIKLFTFKFTSWLVLTRKWHLLALPFQNTEAGSSDSITSFTVLAERYEKVFSTVEMWGEFPTSRKFSHRPLHLEKFLPVDSVIVSKKERHCFWPSVGETCFYKLSFVFKVEIKCFCDKI